MKEIQLVNGPVALVDDEDFPFLNEYKWRAFSCPVSKVIKWYAVTRLKFTIGGTTHRPVLWMHRVILNIEKPFKVDHRDGNGLNNQKNNLRRCTDNQNMWNMGKQRRNTSGYKGVSLDKRTGKWAAQIQAFGKAKNLGQFKNILDAAKAYDKAASALHGEFARPNRV